jgi:hypothetical protein
MDPVAVDIRLIRAVLAPELRIAAGRAFMARVVTADRFGRGALSIAGVLIDAKLPRHVKAGDELRLVVREVSAERVVLGLADQQVPPAPVAVPLPGGGNVRVNEDDDAGASPSPASTQTLALRYDAPTLGAVDLRFELGPQSLRIAVTLPSGGSFELAQAAAGELHQRLGEALARAITVNVSPRREPLDLYA